MRLFTFDPKDFVAAFRGRGYVHVTKGVSEEFLAFAQAQLAYCRETGRNELLAREIKSKKKQYLFVPPDEEDWLAELMRTIGEVTGTPGTGLTLSERHLMVYDDNAARLPALHKDRFASRFSVGIPLESGTGERIALLPEGPRGINVLDNAVYSPRVIGSSAPSIEGWDLNASDFPEAWASETKPTLIELDARPGDVVIFAGSSIYHGRLDSARSSVLYFKLNTDRLDPLGEDPVTDVLHENTLNVLKHKSDPELLECLVELSPRLQHISRVYTRKDWATILRASVSGEKKFIISDEDWSFISALRGRRKIRDVLTDAVSLRERLSERIFGIRRLAKLGAIDILS
jgi:hypothetical protein